jgi:hypothetical protein
MRDELMKSLHARKYLPVAVGSVSVIALVLGLLSSVASAAPNGQSVSATSKDWTVTVWVARTSTKAGTTIPATVTVDNRTDHRVEVTGCVGTIYKIVVGNSKVPNRPVIPTVLCAGTIGPGAHVFHTKVVTTYQTCSGNLNCGDPAKPSALPSGTYHTQVLLPGAKASLPAPRPLTITLTT